MSGSLNNIYNNVSYALYLHSVEMARLQEQVTTGSRINRPSDDPSCSYRVVTLNSQEKSLGNYINNLSETVGILNLSSTVIQDIQSAIVETKVRLTQIMGGIYNEENREQLAEGINDTLEQVVSLANTKHIGQYLFGGSNTTSAPYLAERTNGQITGVTYQGSFENREIDVASGIKSSAFQVGYDIFGSDDRSDPVFLGDTGAAAGSGTSSVKGDTWITVTDDGGGSYDLSIDDGATKVNVAAEVLAGANIANIAVTNASGEVLYVDATNISSTGVDMVSVPGTYNIFDTLISARDLLRNERGLSDAQFRDLQNNSLTALEEINKLIVQAEISVGSKIGFLDNLKDSLTTLKYDAEDESTLLQEADIAQIAIDLSRREVLYQMSLSIAGRLMSVSLLDFL
jgi:flagellar hook-associated protein 3 FlgL